MKKLKIINNYTLHKDFRELLKDASIRYEKDNAFVLKEKIKKEVKYTYITFKQFFQEVNALGTGLLARGKADQRIAIIGKNSYNWITSYMATLCGIGVCVPLDKGLPVDEAEFSIIRSYTDILIFDKEHADLVEEIIARGNTKISQFICMDEYKDYLTLNEIKEEGYKLLADGDTTYENRKIDCDANSIILFTSGTTSMSKAVMLSQRNITTNVFDAISTEPFREGDMNMAFLPYHHTFGSTGQLVMFGAGVCTAYCDGLKYLQKNLVEYKVSVFVCVPLLIESIYKKIMKEADKQGKANLIKYGSKVANFLLKFGIDIRRKLFKSVLEQLGGQVRFIISGASAIDPIALKGFQNFGIFTAQGYGLTETSPILTAESPSSIRLGSVGKPMPHVDVKILNPDKDGIGEVVAKGDNIMSGYYNNEEETDKVLKDGWFHTGDLGYFDKDGFLFLCGRAKNVIVLKNGKNVFPEEVELLINNLPYVEESMVYGEPKQDDENDLAVALKLVYNVNFFKELNLTKEQIQEYVERDIEKINDELPVYKQVRRIRVTDEPMIKTTTGKVKRFEEVKTFQK